MAYIYVITNKINGKQYVGQTTYSIEKRFKEHKKQKNAPTRKRFPLYSAFRKYGFENFIVSELEECSEEKLDEREKFWINKLDTYYHGYNATFGGGGVRKYDKQKIIDTLYKTKSIKETSKIIGCSASTIDSVILNNELDIDFPNKSKPVIQLDKKTGTKINLFSSYREAAKYLYNNGYVKTVKDAQCHISQVCRGKRKTCGGFVWQDAK